MVLAGTFSRKVGRDRESGCPSSPTGPGIKSVEGYNVDQCKPPSFLTAASKGRRLEFMMTGAEGQMKQVRNRTEPSDHFRIIISDSTLSLDLVRLVWIFPSASIFCITVSSKR